MSNASSPTPLAAPLSTDESLGPVLGANLRRLRLRRGLSLERLARASGVSRAMLSQIELGQSTPTINVLWKIARSINVSFSALLGEGASVGTAVILPRSRAKVLASRDGSFSSRALFPVDGPRTVEFYELVILVGGIECADPHPPGTIENLVVARGAVAVTAQGKRHVLNEGDAIHFVADDEHEYRNVGTVDAVLYLVMTYA